ncbi:MAG: helicase-exonuclease AddAB subunit AddB [Coprococcus sp.]
MALQFILGGSGSGKSTQLYKMIIERSMSCPDERILLIVPEQYTMQAQRHIVEAHPCHGVMNVDIISFERLAYRVFDELGRDQKEILEDTGKSMIIRRILSEHKDELFAFRGNIRKQGFVEQVKSMMSELLQYGIKPETLEKKQCELGTESLLYMKLQDICVIYKAFLGAIHGKYMTMEEVPDRLCDIIDDSEFIRNSVIFMDDFTGFTPVQYKLMTHILRLSPLVVMAVTVDALADPYQKVEKENLFYLTKDTIQHLEQICSFWHIRRENDILLADSDTARFSDSRELDVLEKRIFREGQLPYEEDMHDIEACLLSDPRSEMQYVAMRIHDYVSRGEYRYEEIAVVASDMSLYRNGAEYWFGKYGIPCFFDGRRNVSSNMLLEWMRSLLNMFIRNFSYEAVFRYIRCGLSGVAMDEADRLEDYVLALGIRGFGRWNQVWTARQQGMTEEMLTELNQVREKLIYPLAELYDVVQNKDICLVELIRAIYRYMCQLGIRQQVEGWRKKFESRGDLARAKEYEQIYDVMIRLLEQVNLILGQEKMTVREFSDVLETGMSDVRMGIIPPGMDQVTFGDIRRTRLDNVRILFFVGMNDGLVPLVGKECGMITDMERDTLAKHEMKLAPTARENTCTEQFYLYANMTKPSEKLILTCSSQDLSGKEQRISSIFDRIRQIFPKLAVQRIFREKGQLEYPDVNHAYQYLIEGLRDVSEGEKVSEEWIHVYDWFYGQQQYREQTKRLVEAAFYRHWDERLSQAAVKAVYGGQLTGGVTMLEKYAACAYAHFLTYGLRLKERKIFQVQAPDIGMIFHQSIERFSMRIGHSGYQWRDIPDDKRDRMVEECVHSVVLEYNHSVMQDSMRAHYLTEKILRMTKRTIWALQQQLKKGDFDPVGYEIRFTTELETDSMHFEYGDQGTLFLNGKIDRMDICEEEGQIYLKIIDYKSGNTSFDLTSVYHGLQMQLLVYMNAARETEQKKHPHCLVIPAGVLYYHIDDPLTKANDFKDFNTSGESEKMEEKACGEDQIGILELLAVDGLVLDDRDVIYHMDRNPDEAPKVLPIAFKKDGTLTAYSSAAPQENFEVLAWHVRKKTEQLGQEIFSGEIPVDPYYYGQRKACDFCSYKAICGFDTTIGGYGYHRMKKLKKDEVWNAIMKEAGQWDSSGLKNSRQS